MIFVGIALNSAVLRIAKDQRGVGLADGEGEHRMSSDRTDRLNDFAERMKADGQSVVTLVPNSFSNLLTLFPTSPEVEKNSCKTWRGVLHFKCIRRHIDASRLAASRLYTR